VSYQDRELTCVECGQPFTFSADDQSYHAQRGFTNDPKRCPSCREARRQSRDGGSYGSSGGYGGGGGGGGGGYSSRPMYDVVCASCGKQTQVPFQPRGDRPVYCSDCYSQQGGGSRSSYGGGSRRGGGGYDSGGGYGGGRRGGRY
jgi:CxxC-x17-CxxC domain-containing protein